MAHPEEINKVAKVQTQARARARCVGAFKRGPSHSRPKVSEVKEIMMQNIEKVLDRGEKLELLVDKTENLRYQADQFQKGGKALRNKMWWQNVKMKLLVALIVSIVIVVRVPVRTAACTLCLTPFGRSSSASLASAAARTACRRERLLPMDASC